MRRALSSAIAAARSAGALMRQHLNSPKRIHSTSRHDIKIELDVRCQRLIGRRLGRTHPKVPVLGEEGMQGNLDAPWRWVVDPIDGTVNFVHGIPHASVSIALQRRQSRPRGMFDGYASVVGVVLDPFGDELWTAVEGGLARRNGRVIRVSSRTRLSDSMVTVGFAKSRRSLDRMLGVFLSLVRSVRKVRIMGSAALGLTYVASGRFDGYLEAGLRLWDIAAGALIIERAGGRCDCQPAGEDYLYALCASNGRLHRALRRRFDAQT